MAIYDEDVTTNDLIYHNNFKISKDLYGIEVHLDKLPISKAGRLEGDIEFFVDIEVLQNQTHTKSGVVNVDTKAFKQDSGAIVNTVLKVFDPSGEDEKKTENGVCESEARVRAFMRMLRIGEGTSLEQGYTKAFNNNKITDLSKHPEKNYGGSTAAGAYQIMRYTYWWLNGQELDEDNKKTGVYLEKHDYIKKYNIGDYKPESQYKICIVIMKHKRRGLIELIIDGKIEKAIRDIASLEWASLPHVGDNSKYKYKGKLQPATPMKDCLNDYENFLKLELKGKSDLYLKKGFLKEFGYSCCNDTKTSNDSPTSNDCGKANVDLTAKLTFAAQTTGSNCTESCKIIVRQFGVEPEGAAERSKVSRGNESYYQLADENEARTELVFHKDEITNGMKYLDNSLDAGYALVVGVNHTLEYRRHGIINEDTTDHYVVIVGRVCENNQLYYQFWDVGSRHGDKKEYRFKLTSENHLISEKNYRSDGKIYTVTQIRRNKKNNQIVP